MSASNYWDAVLRKHWDETKAFADGADRRIEARLLQDLRTAEEVREMGKEDLARTREVLRALLQRVERGTCAGSHGPDGGWPERLAAVELLKEGP